MLISTYSESYNFETQKTHKGSKVSNNFQCKETTKATIFFPIFFQADIKELFLRGRIWEQTAFFKTRQSFINLDENASRKSDLPRNLVPHKTSSKFWFKIAKTSYVLYDSDKIQIKKIVCCFWAAYILFWASPENSGQLVALLYYLCYSIL